MVADNKSQVVQAPTKRIGVVTIGRNEGARLKACLLSVLSECVCVVYVDSGSKDGSVEMAKAMGADVVQLDMTMPFTAARARNAGFRHLLDSYNDLEFVQFVDGDCEVQAGWIDAAWHYLMDQPGCAAVGGRRRERFPERSVYNLMCDLEWDTPVGDALSCGGDAMMRAAAVSQVGGYREDLIAGEEPDLCLRLRSNGWRIHRLDVEMTKHDAAIISLRQWWRRAVRCGHAFAEGSWLHGATPHRHWVNETLRAILWGCFLPFAIIVVGVAVDARGWWIALIYPLQWIRLSMRCGSPVIGFLTLFGKFAEAQGVLKFYFSKLSGKSGRIIEYK